MQQFLIDFTLHEGKTNDYTKLEDYISDELNKLSSVANAKLHQGVKLHLGKDKTRYVITYDETLIKKDDLKNILIQICNNMYDWAMKKNVSYEHLITDETGTKITYKNTKLNTLGLNLDF